MDPTPPSQANATGDGRGRRVAAFLLSLVEPGAGHFLHGRFRRGAVWAVGLPALALGTLLASRGPYLFHGAIAALAIALLGRLAVALDSLRAARERPAWRSILAGWAALLAVELAVVAPVKAYVRDHHLQAFRVPSGSMRPTLLVGDFFFADKSVYRTRPPARGELVVLVLPTDARERVVKRVVGLPGESIQMRGGRVIVDGRPLPEPYVAGDPPTGVASDDCDPALGCDPVTVKPNSYFVLGDDRANSADSRHWGFIARDRIEGRVDVIYLSWDPARGGLRFGRMGRRL